ncbi:YtpR family tRNA-binding protein [Liquorilactobacillus vini]|uniref:tRNA-binding domain-containing protein n=1 Tax=Liquorilactobacillus vini DSM 20605 TaxID=1133569 RepID=A0A0R2CDI9_9LACO|nr:DUF4479 and tRNA-binding domain-containing protein [Liquorilactobacillus vini]KRM89768.1 tRNA-binding domain-containing protein [Liquorilactobacillus vini DSM 20605]
MLITCYNPAQLGDVLLVILGQPKAEQIVSRKGNIVQIADRKSGQIIGFNFFKVSEILNDLTAIGQVILDSQQLKKLNQSLQAAGINYTLIADQDAKFVVGYVEKCEPHPNSNHLHLTQVRVDKAQKLQIVCGAPNIAAGQMVVVAKVGAMMPNGEIIWPGNLRGAVSNGMICAARELKLPHAPQKRGILVLPPEKYQVGSIFDLHHAQKVDWKF